MTLKEMQRGLEESGRRVLAVAPTMGAVEELQKVGFKDVITVERLLQDQTVQRNLSDRVPIVDEAGMVSGRQMSDLLKLAEQQFMRIVFSGDTRQIRSVEAGDALRVLERESHLKSVSLSEVQRQSAQVYREAVQELRRDPEHGFTKLDQMGAIREASWQDRAQAVQHAYTEAQSQPNAKGQERNVLVVAATHDEIDQITHAIRTERTRAEELGESVSMKRHVSLNWTAAQKSDISNYREGQVLEFHRVVKGIGKNETLEVTGVRNDHVIARNSKGEERQLATKQSRNFVVCERRSIEVAPNDKLFLTANRREPDLRITNGEVATVSRVDEQKRIHLKDGRTLPENYKQFTHGYAVTAHRSQRKSVDAVVISADAMRKELFYVAASRARESICVVTSDKEKLHESVARSDVRQSASELARKGQKLARVEKIRPHSLRESERAQAISQGQGRDRGHDLVQGANELVRSNPTPGNVNSIERDNSAPGVTREPLPDAGLYHGISH